MLFKKHNSWFKVMNLSVSSTGKCIYLIPLWQPVFVIKGHIMNVIADLSCSECVYICVSINVYTHGDLFCFNIVEVLFLHLSGVAVQ